MSTSMEERLYNYPDNRKYWYCGRDCHDNHVRLLREKFSRREANNA